MFRRYPRLNVDIGKQRPSRSIFAAHLSRPRIASPTPANHAAKPNSSAFPPDFFSGLLGGEARGDDELGAGLARDDFERRIQLLRERADHAGA